MEESEKAIFLMDIAFSLLKQVKYYIMHKWFGE